MKMIFASLLLAVTSFFAAPMTSAAELDLNWVAPTHNVDGSVLTDLDGFRVHVGTGSRQYSVVVDIPDETLTSTTVTVELPGLVPGDNPVYAAMTAYDGSGNESVYSNEIIRNVRVDDITVPQAPVVVTLTLRITITPSGDVECPAGYRCTVEVIQ